MSESAANWDMVITSLQDICNAHVSITFDNVYSKYALNPSLLENLSPAELDLLRQEIADHRANVATAQRLISNSQLSLRTLILELQDQDAASAPISATRKRLEHVTTSSGKARSNSPHKPNDYDSTKLGGPKKHGRLYFVSKYNPLEPIYVGLDVAYKLRNRHLEEWIQCEVMRVYSDGVRFEIRDPEPDENNNPGQTFKAGYREIILIPVKDTVKKLPIYPYGTRVLARYPETTTFYTAIVVGSKKDGRVRLKFDGEEEVNKETEVERRLVLPFPDK